MASIKFRTRKSQKNASIYLRLSVSRSETFEKKTGLFIEPSQWSSSTGLPKQTLASNKTLSSKLKKLEIHVLDRLNEAKTQGKEISSKWLQHQINVYFERVSETGQSELLTDAINDIIATADQRKNQKRGLGLSKSRINDYKALERLINEFEGSSKLRVKDIDKPKGEQFLQWLLKEKGYSIGYSLRHMDNLKTVCRDAATKGIKVSPQLPTITSGKVKNDYIIYLTPEELEQIKETAMPHDYLVNAKKWLLLGCEIGQRGGDLLKLTEDNRAIRNGYDVLEFTQQKTGKQIVCPLSPDAQTVLAEGFPRKISTQRFNEYIKEVCKLAGVDSLTRGKKLNPKTNRKEEGTFPKYELVSSHICRRSFGSNNYGLFPTPYIMQITGHSSEKSLLQYIGKSSLDYTQQIAELLVSKAQKNAKQSNLTKVS